MSSKTIKTETTITPPPATGTGVIGGASPIDAGTAPINTGSSKPAGALSMLDILQGMKSSSKLDQAAIDYIGNLNKIFVDSKEDITAIPVSTSKVEARAFVHGATKNCIVLIFAKTHQTLDMTPAALRAIEVVDTLRLQHPDFHIIQNIVVSEEDYSLAGNMAAFISNAFKTFNGTITEKFTVDALKGLKISIVTNIDAVRSYVRSVSPHAVPARDDIGVLLCIDQVKDNLSTGYKESEPVPFMAITGYTRIMHPQDASTGIQFVPIPTISDIVSSIPNQSLLAMALPLAADAFICQSLWCRPYSTFRAGQPNLGNLTMDVTTKKPCFTDSAEAFHMFIRKYMVNPFLAIDVTEGRARPVGIDSLVLYSDSVLNTIRTFLTSKDPNVPPVDIPMSGMTYMSFTNFTGTYMEKGQVKDTRCVDYLELATKVTDHKQIDHLLMQPNSPQARIEAVRAIYPEATRSLYVTTTIVLNAAVVATMSKALNNNIRLNYDMPQDGNINLSNLLMQSAVNNFDNFASFNTGFGRQNMIPQQLGNIYSNLI